MRKRKSSRFLSLMNSFLQILFILGNGERESGMEKVNRYGPMEVFMKDFGKQIKQMVWVD